MHGISVTNKKALRQLLELFACGLPATLDTAVSVCQTLVTGARMDTASALLLMRQLPADLLLTGDGKIVLADTRYAVWTGVSNWFDTVTGATVTGALPVEPVCMSTINIKQLRCIGEVNAVKQANLGTGEPLHDAAGHSA